MKSALPSNLNLQLSDYSKYKINDFQLKVGKLTFLSGLIALGIFLSVDIALDNYSDLTFNIPALFFMALGYYYTTKKNLLAAKLIGHPTFLVLLTLSIVLYPVNFGFYFFIPPAILITLMLWKRKHKILDYCVSSLYGILGILSVTGIISASDSPNPSLNAKLYFVISAIGSTLLIFIIFVYWQKLFMRLFRLHKTEKDQLITIINQFPGYFILVGSDDRIIYSNGYYNHIIEAELNQRPMAGDLIESIFPEKEAYRVKKAIKLAANSSHFITNQKWISKNSEECWLELIYTAIKDSSGKITATLITVIDLTEIKKAEIRHKEASLFMDNSIDPVFKIKLDGALIYTNNKGRSILDHLGCSNKIPEIWIEKLSFEPFVPNQKLEVIANESIYLFEIIKDDETDAIYLYGRNITEANAAKNALNEQKNFFENILNKLPSAVVVFDPNHQFIYWNKIAENTAIASQMYNTRESDYARKLGVSDAVIKIREEKFKLTIESKAATEWIEERPNDQKCIFIQKILVPVLNDDGEIVCILGHGYDITQLIELERKIENQKNLLESVLNALPLSAVLHDETQNLILSNKNAIEFVNTNYGNQKTLNQEVMHSVHKVYKKLSKNHTSEDLKSDKLYQYETEWKTAGNTLHLAVGQIEITTNQEFFTLLFWQDISKQIKDARQIKEQNDFIRTIIDLAPVAIYVKDKQGRFIVANKSSASILGLESGEGLEGKNLSQFHNLENELEHIDNNESKALQNNEIIKAEEILTDKNGVRRYFDSVKSPLVMNDGTVHLLGISNEVTERKRIENELIEAKVTAENNSKAKSYFLSKMSHELRTPLNVIIGYTELILSEKITPGISEYTNNILRSSEYLLELINELLDFSRIESGNVNINKEPVDIYELLNEVTNHLRIKSEQKGLKLTLNIHKNTPQFIISDKIRLLQIFINLGYNAIKYTETGEIKLKVFCTELEDRSAKIKFEIHDTGIGIPENMHDVIFQKFSQLKLKDSKKQDGVGMGLAITKELVSLMNGVIHLESEAGKGSVFAVEIPFDTFRREDTETGLIQSNELPDLSGLVLLLVEDNALNLSMIKRILESTNAELHTAINGEEAIKMTNIHHYDAILMDINMPVTDGFECIKAIRNSDHTTGTQKDVVVIAVTADLYPDTLEKINLYGFNDFISKPYTRKELYRKLRDNIVQNLDLNQAN